MGARRNSNQQDGTTTRMSSSREARRLRRSSPGWDGGEQLYANGHTESQSSSGRAGQQGDVLTSSHYNENISPLATVALEASQQLLTSQEATKVLIDACKKHAQESKEFPELQQKYNKLSNQQRFKDEKIKKLYHTITILQEQSSDRERAAEDTVAANLEESKKLQTEREELTKQTDTANKRLRVKEAELILEVNKKLSEKEAKLDEKFNTYREAQERNMEKREKDQADKLTNLEKSNANALHTINELKAKIEEQCLLLKAESGKCENLEAATSVFKKERGQLAEQLAHLQNEFSLKSKPLEFYTKQFLEISKTVEDVSNRYFGKELSQEEAKSLQESVLAKDALFSDVPFSDSDESVLLRIAHARRVISSALHATIWQPFSSDKSMPGSECSKLLAEIEVELTRSNTGGPQPSAYWNRCQQPTGGSSAAANFWRASTIRILESLPAATRNQESPVRESVSSGAPTSRVVTVVEGVLQVLSPLLNTLELNQFKVELSQIAAAAISVWVDAQADEQDFIE
ncbi:hypothetical protein V498_03380 [Pseudogymnoascus sp. VKM F-4517 (FW-2822)]|nr:hypothetical protein V498_03380 [Pseudogymnoascus sp. VKM F-4517 (FW-2822)]